MSQELIDLTNQVLSEIDPYTTGVERLRQMATTLRKFEWRQRQPLFQFLTDVASKMPELSASDIDFGGMSSQGYIWYRVHGVKRPDPSMGRFTADQTDIAILNMLDDSQLWTMWKERNCDFSYMTISNRVGTDFSDHLRFRADAYFEMGHLALNMRYITGTIRPFKELELHANVARVLSLAHVKLGLVLVTGITGSGKSSTLDAIIDANNKTVDAHVVIIASPIETIHQSQRCIIRHREVGRDVVSFKDGAVQALRQDPDIIVIGEMRDSETVMTALDITDSGHKVFSTLHTASAVESIDRIVAEVPELEQSRVRMRLADVLQCIISQKLVPTIDNRRCLAKEVLIMNSSVRAAIRNNNTSEIYQMIHESAADGMMTIEQDLRRLFQMRRITQTTAMDYANNKKRMQELLAGI